MKHEGAPAKHIKALADSAQDEVVAKHAAQADAGREDAAGRHASHADEADQPQSWLLWCTLLKYAIAAVVAIVSAHSSGSFVQLVAFIAELLMIVAISEVLVRKSRVAGTVVGGLLLLLFLVQVMVLYFGGTFISTIMVTNLEFLSDIQGKAGEYVGAGVVAGFVSFFPTCSIPWTRHLPNRAFLGAAAACLALSCVCGLSHSPGYAYIDLALRMKTIAERAYKLRYAKGDPSRFYQEHVVQGVSRPQSLPESPNVVVIMVEGLSQNIIEDERGIMPNVWEYEQQSLSFANYFNHTAATLRGIVGQLYSGYQNEDFDTNGLVSLQSVLSSQGYSTAFINTEPTNRLFARYLGGLGFDEVVDGRAYADEAPSGPDASLSDKAAYQALLAKMREMDSGQKPFLITMYTFGTHATFDSPDMTYGDGTNPELNKFYNADHWFGQFMEEFNNSPMLDDTIIVFTTDHATYKDKSYRESFPDYERRRPFLDRIPLFVYYKGIEHRWVDAAGQNSLDMTPTVLDLLDVDCPNYFLGQSLFAAEDQSAFDVYYVDTQDRTSSNHGDIEIVLGKELRWLDNELLEYFMAARTGV